MNNCLCGLIYFQIYIHIQCVRLWNFILFIVHSYESKPDTYVMFWPVDPAKNAIQGNAPEGGDTFWWQLWEEIAMGGNWLMKWDEVKKIPLYSHRPTHRKRVTSELDDSYFRSMTITQAIPKKAEVTHPGSPDIGSSRGGVSISARGSLKVI